MAMINRNKIIIIFIFFIFFNITVNPAEYDKGGFSAKNIKEIAAAEKFNFLYKLQI